MAAIFVYLTDGITWPLKGWLFCNTESVTELSKANVNQLNNKVLNRQYLLNMYYVWLAKSGKTSIYIGAIGKVADLILVLRETPLNLYLLQD